MFYWVLILMFFVSWPVSAQNVASSAVSAPVVSTLIRNISIEGFLLQDKNQFVKLFKPYRNKYLTTSDMDEILQKIQVIYEQDGYQQLVSITYRVNKHRLVFTVSLAT